MVIYVYFLWMKKCTRYGSQGMMQKNLYTSNITGDEAGFPLDGIFRTKRLLF